MHFRNQNFNNFKNAYKTHTKHIQNAYEVHKTDLCIFGLKSAEVKNAYEIHTQCIWNACGFLTFFYFFQIQILCCGYKMGQLSDLLVDWNLLEHSTSSEHSLTNGSSIRPTCELKFTWGLHFTWAIIHTWVSYQTYLWIQIYLSIEVDVSHKYQLQV